MHTIIKTLMLLVTISLYGAEQKQPVPPLQLPSIKKGQQKLHHHKHRLPKRALESRIASDGTQEYFIRPEGQKVAYWLNKETIQQLADLEARTKIWKEASKKGMSYNRYVRLEARGLLYEQMNKKKL
jgi:hypothetical protein